MPALADEIARLSKENAQLRSQIARGGSEDTFAGLSFNELKAMLDEKGLLSFLEKNRLGLGSVNGIQDRDGDEETSELCVMGLIKADPRIGLHGNTYHRYVLTDAGQTFLNKLEAQKRVSQQA